MHALFVSSQSCFAYRSGKMKIPEWTDLVKQARYNELSPYDPDWYYIRAGRLQ